MKEVSFQESKFVEKFTIFASKMGNEIHLRSLRDAFATIMPLYILAGLAVLINNTVFVWLLSGDTLTGAQYWGTVITNGTLNISSLLIAPVIGYCLSRNKGFDNPMAAAIVSLAALVVMMPNVVSVTPLEGGESVAVSGALTFGNVGTQAMFAGVIIGLIATELFVWISGIKKLQIDLGDSIPPSVGKSFNVVIPFILLLSGFGLISAVLNNVFDPDDNHSDPGTTAYRYNRPGWLRDPLQPGKFLVAVRYSSVCYLQFHPGAASDRKYDTEYGCLCSR